MKSREPQAATTATTRPLTRAEIIALVLEDRAEIVPAKSAEVCDGRR